MPITKMLNPDSAAGNARAAVAAAKPKAVVAKPKVAAPATKEIAVANPYLASHSAGVAASRSTTDYVARENAAIKQLGAAGNAARGKQALHAGSEAVNFLTGVKVSRTGVRITDPLALAATVASAFTFGAPKLLGLGVKTAGLAAKTAGATRSLRLMNQTERTVNAVMTSMREANAFRIPASRAMVPFVRRGGALVRRGTARTPGVFRDFTYNAFQDFKGTFSPEVQAKLFKGITPPKLRNKMGTPEFARAAAIRDAARLAYQANKKLGAASGIFNPEIPKLTRFQKGAIAGATAFGVTVATEPGRLREVPAPRRTRVQGPSYRGGRRNKGGR